MEMTVPAGSSCLQAWAALPEGPCWTGEGPPTGTSQVPPLREGSGPPRAPEGQPPSSSGPGLLRPSPEAACGRGQPACCRRAPQPGSLDRGSQTGRGPFGATQCHQSPLCPPWGRSSIWACSCTEGGPWGGPQPKGVQSGTAQTRCLGHSVPGLEPGKMGPLPAESKCLGSPSASGQADPVQRRRQLCSVGLLGQAAEPAGLHSSQETAQNQGAWVPECQPCGRPQRASSSPGRLGEESGSTKNTERGTVLSPPCPLPLLSRRKGPLRRVSIAGTPSPSASSTRTHFGPSGSSPGAHLASPAPEAALGSSPTRVYSSLCLQAGSAQAGPRQHSLPPGESLPLALPWLQACPPCVAGWPCLPARCSALIW